MRRTGLIVLLTLSAAFNVGFATTFGVRTYRSYCRDSESAEPPCRRALLVQLELTPNQRAGMEQARDDLCRQVETLRGELAGQQAALADLLMVDEPDRVAIDAQLDCIAGIQRKVQQCVVEHLLNTKGLLDADQRESYRHVIRTCCGADKGCGAMGSPGECRMSGADSADTEVAPGESEQP